MQNNVHSSDTEISLAELWHILVRHKGWVVGIPLLAVIAAINVLIVMKPQWQAKALVQIGQARKLTPIESVANVMGRIKDDGFQQTVVTSIGLPLNSPSATLFQDSLKIDSVPNSADMIQISLRGYSREQAKQFLEATFSILRKIHDQIAAPTTLLLKQRIAQVDRQIAQMRAEGENLAKLPNDKKNSASGELFQERILRDYLMVQRDAELNDALRVQKNYEDQLSRTYPTSITGTVYVSPRPVAPKKALIIALAGIPGLLIGMFVAFIIDGFQTRNSGAK
jgi:hypothetical protein